MYKEVTMLTLTYNRDKCLQRLLRSFLEQDYEGKSNLVVFNSGFPTKFPELELPTNKRIILINKDTNNEGKPF